MTKRDEIIKKIIELENQPTHTARDVALAAELVSQYIDELERLEKTATVKPYLSGDAVADKVLSFWSYDG